MKQISLKFLCFSALYGFGAPGDDTVGQRLLVQQWYFRLQFYEHEPESFKGNSLLVPVRLSVLEAAQ